MLTGFGISSALHVQPEVTSGDCICKYEDVVCKCTLVIQHKLTMILEKEKQLVVPQNGYLRVNGSDSRYATLKGEEAKRVITADGQGSRLVIAINDKFPGPRIEVYENQTIQVTIRNTLHTDSVTVHFHGIHQKGTPHMDGVAFISQCPISPGQEFVPRFKAYPPGTFFYHAHIGDQRSMGLYGPFIVRRAPTPSNTNAEEIIVTLQDWNHLMDAETAYNRMITEQFDFSTGERIPTTSSIDGAQFSRFEFHSGLVNGKGRFYFSRNSHNGAPLETFRVRSGITYRFRVIGAATLYPMRIYIQGQKITLFGSDGFNLEQITVESIVVHPGERFDFLWQAPATAPQKRLLLVAKTLETLKSLKMKKYHAAEAVLEFEDYLGLRPPNPMDREICGPKNLCVVFNCPYRFYPQQARICLSFNDVKNNDTIKNPEAIFNSDRPFEEVFFNFGFPGVPGNTPGSVNGRQFISPPSAYLTQPEQVTRPCDPANCERDISECTNVHTLIPDRLYQFVLTNIGNGAGWSHPVHLHGHSFYVMKIGFGTYDERTGRLMSPTKDIRCTDANDYCLSMQWTDSSWINGNVPGMNTDPPLKDTILIPTGTV